MIISKATTKRIISDIVEVSKPSLKENGIYYQHDEKDILKGYALIIGNKDSVYANGYYLFKFSFPTTYPHQPPEVLYLTNDGETRFNPNLYKSGKVCLSILGTWDGDPWDGTQSISSILLSICTLVLHNTPLLNEPQVTRKHQDYNKYHEILTYKNYEIAIHGILSKKYLPKNCECFYEIMQDHFLENYNNIVQKLDQLSGKYSRIQTISIYIYPQTIQINYSKMKNLITNLYNNLKKEKLK
jgi:ubiquitin-conjugating enzyme E2 Z